MFGSKKETDYLRNAVTQLSTRIAAADSENTCLKKDLSDMQRKVDFQNKQIDELYERCSNLNERYNNVSKDIAVVKSAAMKMSTYHRDVEELATKQQALCKSQLSMHAQINDMKAQNEF